MTIYFGIRSWRIIRQYSFDVGLLSWFGKKSVGELLNIPWKNLKAKVFVHLSSCKFICFSSHNLHFPQRYSSIIIINTFWVFVKFCLSAHIGRSPDDVAYFANLCLVKNFVTRDWEIYFYNGLFRKPHSLFFFYL